MFYHWFLPFLIFLNDDVMRAVCPITNKRIDERVARVNGLIVLLLVLSFIVFNFWVALVVLVVDFMLRGFVNGKYSLVTNSSKWLVSKMNIKPKMQNAGPKIFAAQVGVVFSLIALVLFATGCGTLCLMVAGILGFFAFLESAFGYCVACKLYPLFRRAK